MNLEIIALALILCEIQNFTPKFHNSFYAVYVCTA